jgi:hypothetical protein
MANFELIFGIALLVDAALSFRSSDYYKRWSQRTGGKGEEGASEEVKKKHAALLKKYLFVYLLATLSDWLQGPYVYALYAAYGFKQSEIAQLFVAGFGSSMIFGSFIGGMADWGGRRAFVMLFAVVYAASCMTKRTYSVLSEPNSMVNERSTNSPLLSSIAIAVKTLIIMAFSCWAAFWAELQLPYSLAFLRLGSSDPMPMPIFPNPSCPRALRGQPMETLSLLLFLVWWPTTWPTRIPWVPSWDPKACLLVAF